MNHPRTFLFYLLSCLLLTAAILGATHRLWYHGQIQVTFLAKQQKAVNYSVFYTEAPGEKFSQERSVTAVSRKERYTPYVRLKAALPTKHLHHLRIDIGSAPGTVVLKDICLGSGRDKLPVLQREEDIRFNSHIEAHEETAQGLCLISNLNDPFISTKHPVMLSVAPTVDIPALLGFVLIGLYAGGILAYLLPRWFRKAEHAGKNGKAYLNIEWLRVVFTLFVVCNHFINRRAGDCMGGSYAVTFFFILSGYLLTVTYRPNKVFGDFAMQKLIRWVPLAVAGALLCGGGWESLYNILLIHNTGLAFTDVANGPAWYLGVLFWVSVFLFAAIRFLPSGVCTLLIGTLTFIGLMLCARYGEARERLVWDFCPIGLVRGICGMGLGYLLSLICRRPAQRPQLRIDCTLAELGLVLYICISTFNPTVRLPYFIMVPLTMVSLLCLFIQQRGLLSRLAEQRCLAFGAKYCLAVYLTHYALTSRGPLKDLMNTGCADLGLDTCYSGLLLALPCSILLGVAAHHLVEQPMTELLTCWCQSFKAQLQQKQTNRPAA